MAKASALNLTLFADTHHRKTAGLSLRSLTHPTVLEAFTRRVRSAHRLVLWCASAPYINYINFVKEADMFEALSAAQVHLFQVSIAQLTKLTKLDFGKLADADAHEATTVGPRLIESYDDIRI